MSTDASPVPVGTIDDTDFSSLGYSFKPTMAIVLVVMVVLFLFLGMVLMYIRKINAGDANGNPVNWQQDDGCHGMDPDMVKKFPIRRYASVKRLGLGKEEYECVVCLTEFKEDDKLRLLSECGHSFHPDCIDKWLRCHTTCPLCRHTLGPVVATSCDPSSASNPNSYPVQELSSAQQRTLSNQHRVADDQNMPAVRSLSHNSESLRMAAQDIETDKSASVYSSSTLAEGSSSSSKNFTSVNSSTSRPNDFSDIRDSSICINIMGSVTNDMDRKGQTMIRPATSSSHNIDLEKGNFMSEEHSCLALQTSASDLKTS